MFVIMCIRTGNMVNRLYVLIFYYDFPHRRPISEIAQTYKRGCSEGGKPNSRFYLAICREKEQQKASGVRRQEVCLICNMHLNTHIVVTQKYLFFARSNVIRLSLLSASPKNCRIDIRRLEAKRRLEEFLRRHPPFFCLTLRHPGLRRTDPTEIPSTEQHRQSLP